MHPNQQTLEMFYGAFARLDPDTMARCYADDVAFDDEVFSLQDRFDFWRWSRQALGAPGVLLGWTPMLRGKVRGQAGANLQRFLAKEPQ